MYPEKYLKPHVRSNPWEYLGAAAAIVAAEPALEVGAATIHHPHRRVSIGADCAGMGSAIEAAVGVMHWEKLQ